MKHTGKPEQAEVATAAKPNYMQYLVNAWVFLPVLMLFKVISDYSVNIPYVDDYHAVLQFLSGYKHANGLSEKASLFFQQYNEHRLAYSKLIYLIYYKLTGGVNFINLIIINNLHWIAAFVILIPFMKRLLPKRWNIAAFVVAIAMFDINNYENSNAAMFGMQNYGLVTFFLLSMFFYSKQNNKALIWAVLCQVICIYSSAGGLIVSIALLLYAILQKSKMNIIACAATTIVFCGLYFVGYVKPASSQGAVDLAVSVPFFLHQVGAHFGYIYGITFGVMMLILLLVVLPVSKRLVIPDAAKPFIAILAFCFASMLATALFRSQGAMLMSYSSRYFIYSHLIISVIFIFMLYKIEGKQYQWPVTIAFILVMLYAYKENYEYGVAGFDRAKNRLEYSEYYWPFPDTETPKNIAIQACKDEIYCIDEER